MKRCKSISPENSLHAQQSFELSFLCFPSPPLSEARFSPAELSAIGELSVIGEPEESHLLLLVIQVAHDNENRVKRHTAKRSKDALSDTVVPRGGAS